MTTNRLYRAIKEKQDSQTVHDAATFNGNYGPPKPLRHDSPLVCRLREANVELQLAMEEARAIIEAPTEGMRRVAVRIAGERDIARHLLHSLAEQGFDLQTNDGEDETEYTKDWKGLHARAFDTDELYINVRVKADTAPGLDDGEYGWIHLIYGNSPEEMISDHTINLTKYLIPTQEYIKAFYDPSYIIDKGE